MWLPLQTLWNNFIGAILCTVCFTAVYYSNVWQSQNFPFLSQLLFDKSSTADNYEKFNQTSILTENFVVDYEKLEESGVPYFAGSFITALIGTNVAITATFSHLLLFNYRDIKDAWSFAKLGNLKRMLSLSSFKFWSGPGDTRDPNTTDPHLKLMLAYRDAPNWWYGLVFVGSATVGLTAMYVVQSTLPFWGFAIAVGLATVCTVFFGAQFAITGFAFIVQPVIQMMGGYLHPGRPVANMYFTLVVSAINSQARLPLLRSVIDKFQLCPAR
jgi:OPT oligopeptide transporter protein